MQTTPVCACICDVMSSSCLLHNISSHAAIDTRQATESNKCTQRMHVLACVWIRMCFSAPAQPSSMHTCVSHVCCSCVLVVMVCVCMCCCAVRCDGCSLDRSVDCQDVALCCQRQGSCTNYSRGSQSIVQGTTHTSTQG